MPAPGEVIDFAIAPGQALILAEQKRRRGFLADADELTRRAAQAEPDNAEAAHMLGLIAHQSGKNAEAIEHLRRAITIKPDISLYHANLGEMCRLSGRTEEAIAAGRRAIALDPNNAGAHSNLGIALFDQGKFEEALGLYQRAIALDPSFAQAHSNLGNALQRLKRFAEAEPSYRRAIELQPSFADGWNNLGTCLRELKRSEEAETVYRKALEFAPNNPDTLDNLALALKDLERLDEAADLMRRALVIESNSDKLYLHYGSVLLDQHKTEEAAAAIGRAMALNPNNHDNVNMMGRIAFDRGDLDESLAFYRRALAIKPDLADAHNNMGNTLKELGRLREAQEAYQEALRIDPNIAGAYTNLANSKTFKPGDPHLAAMEALAAKTEGLSKDDRLQLDFGLGKAYADLKDYPRSFKHYLSGNASKRAGIAYDEASTLQLFDRIEAVFSKELITAKSGGGDPSATPIFVIGMPRSGTTLIEQIIASHPLAHGAGELQTLNDVILEVRGPDGNTLPFPEFVPAADADRVPPDRRALSRSGPRARGGKQRRGRARPIHHRQDAVELLFHRPDPSRAAACENHSFDARSGRHLHLVLLEIVLRRAEPHLRSRRARPLLQTLRAIDGALAPRAAAGPHARRAIRGRGRRSGNPGAPHHRLLRPALGRRLPRLPQDRPPGAHRKRHPGAPADLQKRGRPVAGL